MFLLFLTPYYVKSFIVYNVADINRSEVKTNMLESQFIRTVLS